MTKTNFSGDAGTDTYDHLHYASKVHPGRHPAHFAAMAKLYAVSAPALENSSILEIGCATAQALIPLALSLPDTQFTGIDPSLSQITAGRKTCQELGIKNIKLLHCGVDEIAQQKLSFDYIICHGVFSWVSPKIQQSILSLCHTHLSANGIAYISYNTNPGWNFRKTVRDLLHCSVDRKLSPQAQIGQARQILQTFEGSIGRDYERPYSLMLSTELARIRSESDSYLFHEFLEENNHPVFFHEFISAARAHSLKVIADAHFSRNGTFRFDYLDTANVEKPNLEQLSLKAPQTKAGQEDLTAKCSIEQFGDFVFNNSFRESLLCHDNLISSEQAQLSVLNEFYLTASYQPLSQDEQSRDSLSVSAERSQANFFSNEEVQFEDLAGRKLFPEKACLKLSLNELWQEWPRAIRLGQLLDTVEGLLAAKQIKTSLDREALFHALLELICKDGITLFPFNPKVANSISASPKVTKFTQHQAKHSAFVTNLKYETVCIGELERELIQFLDGTRHLPDIAQALLESFNKRGATLKEGGEIVTDPEQRLRLVTTLSADLLETLRRAALLS